MELIKAIVTLIRWTVKLILTGILLMLVAYFLASSNWLEADNKLALALNQGLVQVEAWLSKAGVLPNLAMTERKASQADTDDNQAQGARWPQNQARVYLELTDPKLKRACLVAMSAWNDTGAFKFVQTTDKDKAQIICRAISDSTNGAAGETETDLALPQKQLTHATVYLNKYYLFNPSYSYSWQRIINTAEHELGHAIGLRHTKEISVMQPTGSNYSIQPADVTKVRELYSR